MTGVVSGFTYGAGVITITNAGTYAITYSATCTTGSVQFALSLNNSVDGSAVYGSADGEVNGQTILTTGAGSTLSLLNTSLTPVVLATGLGGVYSNVNASILIEKLA